MRRLGVDFGDTETVIAETSGSGGNPPAHVVSADPNLVSLAEDGSRIMGLDVLRRGLDESAVTVQHLRHFILNNSPVQVRCGGHCVSYPDLGREYLVSLIQRAAATGDPDIEEVVFSVPPGSPLMFREWLGSVAAGSGITKYSVMDEISAAAAGYGFSLEDDMVLMVIDIGDEKTTVTLASLGPRETLNGSRIIARTISDLSGTAIDCWIAHEVRQRDTRKPGSWGSGGLSPELLAACRKARTDLTCGDTAKIFFTEGRTGENIARPFSGQDLENTIHMNKGLFELDRVISQTLILGESRGHSSGSIQHVLMTGKDSLIPSLQAVIVSKFGRERVHCNLPATAVALGAALHPAGTENSRTLERDYALRYWDAGTSRHEFRYIARSGTAYPTRQATARVFISAAFDGQTHLGLAVYALGGAQGDKSRREIELVSDREGRMRCMEREGSADTIHATRINENFPTILVAIPPGRKGDVRFELTFSIDSLGILRLDARDVMTGEMLLKNHSCAELK